MVILAVLMPLFVTLLSLLLTEPKPCWPAGLLLRQSRTAHKPTVAANANAAGLNATVFFDVARCQRTCGQAISACCFSLGAGGNDCPGQIGMAANVDLVILVLRKDARECIDAGVVGRDFGFRSAARSGRPVTDSDFALGV